MLEKNSPIKHQESGSLHVTFDYVPSVLNQYNFMFSQTVMKLCFLYFHSWFTASHLLLGVNLYSHGIACPLETVLMMFWVAKHQRGSLMLEPQSNCRLLNITVWHSNGMLAGHLLSDVQLFLSIVSSQKFLGYSVQIMSLPRSFWLHFQNRDNISLGAWRNYIKVLL